MGTLSSELGPHAERITRQPRVYVDANMPAGLVAYMRDRLQWDVLFVIEHDELRRGRDGEHFRLARQLRRTLLTLDRDYLDDRKFPPAESGGVLVLTAPDEGRYAALLKRLDAEIFRLKPEPTPDGAAAATELTGGSDAASAFPRKDAEFPLPLEGQKLHVHVDWAGPQRGTTL
jgi:hypothetical protein